MEYYTIEVDTTYPLVKKYIFNWFPKEWIGISFSNDDVFRDYVNREHPDLWNHLLRITWERYEYKTVGDETVRQTHIWDYQ